MARDLVAVTDAQSPFRTTLHSLSVANSDPEVAQAPVRFKDESFAGQAEDVIVDDHGSDEDDVYETYWGSCKDPKVKRQLSVHIVCVVILLYVS